MEEPNCSGIGHTCTNICNAVARDERCTCYASYSAVTVLKRTTKQNVCIYEKLSAIVVSNHWRTFLEFVFVIKQGAVLGIMQLLMHFS